MSDRKRWRRVPGWPGYKVSSDGEVRSVDRVMPNGTERGGQPLKPHPDKDGYLHVTLHDGDRVRRFAVHRLVLLAFEGPCPDGMEVLHEGRRQDNRLTRLRYGTHLENERDKWKGKGEGKEEDGIEIASRPPLAVSRPVSLAEAAELGVVVSTLPGLRMARHRDDDFPGWIELRGATHLYDPAALRLWDYQRRGIPV